MNNEIKRKERKQNELSIQEIEEKIKTLNKEEKIRKYTKGKLLGRGGFAYCYEFVCQDNNKHFAAKVINKENLKQPRQKQKLLIEIKIHKSLHHNQVVAFEHYFEDKENVYILLELCYHQTLNELLKRRKTLSELEVQCYMIQLIKGLQYLHSHKIIHRDLKLGNLFLTDKMELKIGDFGLATKLDYDGEKKRTVCGTPNYIAPEVLDGEHSYEVDVWAIGIIIYTLLIGKPPFEARDLNSTYKNIREINFNWPEHCKVSYCAMKLVKKILVKDPKLRPSFDEILKDDFFNQGSAIPKLLPSAALATPPTLDYIKRFIPNLDKNGVSQLHYNERIEEEKREKEKEEKEKKEKEEKERKEKEEKEEKERREKERKAKKEKKEETEKKEEKNDLNSTKENSNNNIINESIIQNEEKNKPKEAEIFIVKWVDYSSKYGLGYLLNNQYIGVYFNDCTKLIYNPRNNKISFIERKLTKEKEMKYTFGLTETPKELQKKILIFQQFKKYFEEENKNKEKSEDDSSKHKSLKSKKKGKQNEQDKNKTPETKEEEKDTESIFLRKWIKTNQAIIFRFSDKTIQVIFKDHTEIILFNDMVSYKDKNKNIKIFKIEEAINSSNFEMNKRIKYVQNIFTKIINNNTNNQKNEEEKEKEKNEK